MGGDCPERSQPLAYTCPSGQMNKDTHKHIHTFILCGSSTGHRVEDLSSPAYHFFRLSPHANSLHADQIGRTLTALSTHKLAALWGPGMWLEMGVSDLREPVPTHQENWSSAPDLRSSPRKVGVHSGIYCTCRQSSHFRGRARTTSHSLGSCPNVGRHWASRIFN